MKLKIVRVDKSLPLPEYKTEGAVAFDMYARTDAEVPAGKTHIVPSNLIIEVPKGYYLMIAARSGSHKKGFMLGNGVGILDQDYHGPKDEIGIVVYNFTNAPVTIPRGDRIAQGLIIPIARAEWEEVENIKEDSRGGFGSTG